MKIEQATYSIGDRVNKSTGYEFPGIVVSVFLTKQSNIRYVVEHENALGLLHIFSEAQLRIRK